MLRLRIMKNEPNFYVDHDILLASTITAWYYYMHICWCSMPMLNACQK